MTPTKKHTLVYYEWKDVEHAICDSLNIDHSLFRDYHKVIGGDYKDLWHLWLWLESDRVYNDVICKIWICLYEDTDEYFVQKVIKHFGEWALDVIEHIFDVLQTLAEDNDYIFIHYEW